MKKILSILFFIIKNIVPFFRTIIDYFIKQKIKLILGGKELNNMILTFPSFGVHNLLRKAQNDDEILNFAESVMCFFQVPSKRKPINNVLFRVFPIVSLAEVRSVSYLNSLLSSIDITPKILPDKSETIEEDYSSNLISFGLSCTKSEEIINDNPFIEINKGTFMSSGNFSIKGSNLSFQNSREHSYAIIIRKTLVERNTRIVCAGFDEWGTSGAAYCLAKQYNVIYDNMKKINGVKCFYKIPDFLCIVDAVREYDERAKIVAIWIEDDKVKNSIRKIL